MIGLISNSNVDFRNKTMLHKLWCDDMILTWYDMMWYGMVRYVMVWWYVVIWYMIWYTTCYDYSMSNMTTSHYTKSILTVIDNFHTCYLLWYSQQQEPFGDILLYSPYDCNMWASRPDYSCFLGKVHIASSSETCKRKTGFINILQWRHNERDGVSNHWRLDC